MDAETLLQRITAAQAHLETLRRYACISPDHQSLVDESWRELNSTLQELAESAQTLSWRVAQDDAVWTSIVEGIIVFDPHGTILTMNPAATAMFGPDLQGKSRAALAERLGACGADGRSLAQDAFPGSRALRGERVINETVTFRDPQGQSRSVLASASPLLVNGCVAGAVVVWHDLTEREQITAQLQNERARLRAIIAQQEQMEKALEQSNRDMQLLNRLGQELGSSLDLARVLERVLEALRALIPAEDSTIWLWDEERSGWLVCRAAFGSRPGQSILDMRLRVGQGIVGWVAQHRESVIIPDLAQDRRVLAAVYTQAGSQAKSMLAVPLLARDRVTGVLALVNKVAGEFDARDRTLVETLSASAAIAIENARLHDQAMQAAVAAERSRLARDLHDAVSQTLFSASVISETLPRLGKRDPQRVERGLEQLHKLTRGALAEMRTLLVELRPAALLETNLGDLMQQLAEATMSRTVISVSVEIEAKCALPPEVHIALYRIAQEALNNVVKHARARHVALGLRACPDHVELRVRDDGRGFDPDRVPAGHLGLGIMRERAQSMGITLDIASRPGQGVEIVAIWPYPSHASAQ